MPKLRTPIVCVVGHVDHGKTTLLDRIRGSAVAKKEAGAITQHIGATEVPIDVIKELCGALMTDKFLAVPGLLFIDTPGHHAFTTLRSRGSSLADLAILVVDVVDGFQPQTYETLKILKRYKTPFVVAANKIDRLTSWNKNPKETFMATYAKQPERVQRMLDDFVYRIVGKLSDEGFSSDRYDHVSDFQRNICVVPVSAKTGEGIADLLMILVGLAQKFLESDLQLDEKCAGCGTVLEVGEEKGIGATVDLILWEGELKQGDTIVVAGAAQPIVTKVRTLLKPSPLTETKGEKFVHVAQVSAAAGIKVAAPNLEKALAGLPMRVVGAGPNEVDAVVKEVKSETAEMMIKADAKGIITRADTLGSLEALFTELKESSIPVQKAEVGDVVRRDVMEAAALKGKDPLLAAILGFNVKVLQDAKEEAAKVDVPIFTNDVIYKLIDDYRAWAGARKEAIENEKLNEITRPGKIKILPDCVFRVSKPAIVGVRVLGGVIRPDAVLMKNDGKEIGNIKSIQNQGASIPLAKMGEEVAVSIDGPTVGRQIKEGDELYVSINERDAKALRSFSDKITADEMDVLEEIVKKKREMLNNPLWGL